MAKWEDYVITKLSMDTTGKMIEVAFVYDDYENHIDNGELRNRDWLVAKARRGKTFCSATKVSGGWKRIGVIDYVNDSFNGIVTLPKALVKRKTFVSYYHFDDQAYRHEYEKLFSDLIISKSVETDDIDSENSDDYIKQLIHKDYISEITILVVLVGPKTKCRKHVDWEISGALSHRVGERYAGLIGILLPTHPDYGKTGFETINLPKRLAENVKSGYASVYDWTTDRVQMQNWIELAFSRRTEDEKILNSSILQMKENTCD